jgi:hypothetical protein
MSATPRILAFGGSLRRDSALGSAHKAFAADGALTEPARNATVLDLSTKLARHLEKILA